jgi:peroxiredoxin
VSKPYDNTMSGRSILLGAFLLFASSAFALNEGEVPTPFRLPDLSGEGSHASDSLLKVRPWTLLVIWNTNCPDCMADVVKIGRHVTRTDSLPFQVVGVVTDDERIGDARRLVKGTKLRFLNLWDASGVVAAAFGADAYSFSSFLIDSVGTVHAIQYDHPESIDPVLKAAHQIATGAPTQEAEVPPETSRSLDGGEDAP